MELKYVYFICIVIAQESLQQDGEDVVVSTTLDAELVESPTTEEEWHMDFMPTGYLPDSVYRELAWYSINQIQPLLLSSKNRMLAIQMWKHTLNRPHVIMETPPQSLQTPGKVSRQILAEEASKWSKEQRTKQEILMETVKTGGNGLTVRTVVSNSNTTILIIQGGFYYVCPEGSSPDMVTYRNQANLHEKRCTFGKVAEKVNPNIDPCIDVENTPIEYSFNEGWMFCLGAAERDNVHFKNGTIDCGQKTKILLDDFLKLCAIDNNIVITFDYFGDEPRKELLHNGTICSAWDPCKVSYLYRFEPPPEMPAFPTTTENPCNTTLCPECIVGHSTEQEFRLRLSDEEDKK